MSVGKLYGPLDNFRVLKVKLVSELEGIEIDSTPEFELFKTNETEDFLKKFPLGKSPAFETKDGSLLTESSAIAHYIASLNPNSRLLSQSPFNQAKILQFVLFSETSVIDPAMNIVLRRFNLRPSDELADDLDLQRLIKSLNYLNSELEGKSYLVGDSLSLADISIFTDLIYPFKYVLNNNHRKDFNNVIKYFENIFNLVKSTKLISKLEYSD